MLRDRNWARLHGIAADFANKTNGVFYGVIGALDGLALRITSPTLNEVAVPGNFYCRKGFFALNVQAICDRQKRFLWCYPMNKGSTHDSAAFGGSQLIELLKELAPELEQQGLFLVGDAAYALASYMMVPYDKTELDDDPLKIRDSFNYYLSACRIFIECAFGELVMRWGMFWRTMRFSSLKKTGRVIQATMLLHNFIVDERAITVNNSDECAFFANFDMQENSSYQVRITNETLETPIPLVTDNNEPKPLGRPHKHEELSRRHGYQLRASMTLALSAHNLSRPLETGMKYNKYGNIYMTY